MATSTFPVMCDTVHVLLDKVSKMAIAEAALRSHCRVLYSEDFGHGQQLVGGWLLVQNPLLAS